MLDLTIIDFPAHDEHGRPCGMQGEPFPDACTVAFANVSGACGKLATWQACSRCLMSPATRRQVEALGCDTDAVNKSACEFDGSPPFD